MLDDDWSDEGCGHPTLVSVDSQVGYENAKGVKPSVRQRHVIWFIQKTCI